jgi:hypothetical protein
MCIQKLALQIRGQLENVTDLRPAEDDHLVKVKIKCTSCQEVHPKSVGFNKTDETELSKGRSSANLVMSCHVSDI